MMKKMMMFLLAALLLAGCGSGKEAPRETVLPEGTTAAEETLREETMEEEEPLPPMVEVRVLADRTPAVLGYLQRGDTLDLVGEKEQTEYVVRSDLGYGLISADLVRTSHQEPYEEWDGFARWGCSLFEGLYLTGEAESLPVNTQVHVLEDLGSSLLVQVGEKTGFVQKDLVSQWRIKPSGGASGGSSGGVDGGDIEMQDSWQLRLLSLVEQSGQVSGTVTVKADGTPLILGYFDRDQVISVVKDPDPAHSLPGHETIYAEGIFAYVPSYLVRREGEAACESRDAYAVYNTKAYDNYLLQGEPVKTMYVNEKVTILEEFPGSYLVSQGEDLFFVAKTMLRDTPQKSAPQGGSGGQPDSGWTPPQM